MPENLREPTMTHPLWTPDKDRVRQTTLAAFSFWMSSRTGKALHAYDDLHRYSTDDPAAFWSALWDFTKVSGDKGGGPLLRDAGRMPGAQFFPNARLNFAENQLKHAGSGDAVVFRGEDKVKRRLSWDELSWARPRSVQCGRRARPISACRAYSTASGRSSRRCSSPAMATTTTARRSTSPTSWRRSPRVPAKIVQIAETPRSKSDKISGLAVVHGRDIKNREALANPAAVDIHRNIAERTR
jgi:hypothetical protein